MYKFIHIHVSFLSYFYNPFQSIIPTLVHDSVEANSDKEKAEMLSTYFAESWNTLVPPLCPEAQRYSDVDPSSLDDLLCTEEEVCHLLENLNVSKAAGLDRISAQMLKRLHLLLHHPFV